MSLELAPGGTGPISCDGGLVFSCRDAEVGRGEVAARKDTERVEGKGGCARDWPEKIFRVIVQGMSKDNPVGHGG